MPTWITDSSQRLDAFLAAQQTDMSRARLQKAIENGGVAVDGVFVYKPAYKLRTGQEVVFDPVSATEERTESIEPVDLKLDVLYEDDACLVLNKSAGIAVHPGSGMGQDEKTVLHGVAHLFAERSLPFSADAVLVHRLDKNTTGCLLVAKTSAAHHALQQQFEQRKVEKRYLALVAGVPHPPQAKIDAPIGRSLADRTKMSVLRTATSRSAQTTYTTLDATDEAALLECELHTGRTHQIRVHLQSVGHPILGDATYGSAQSQRLSEQYHVESVCLHAHRLTFRSPAGEEMVTVEAPIPEAFRVAMDALQIRV